MIAITVSLLVVGIAFYYFNKGSEYTLPVLTVAYAFDGLTFAYAGIPFSVPEVLILVLVPLEMSRLVTKRRKVKISTIWIASGLIFISFVSIPIGQYFLANVETSHYGFIQQPNVRLVLTGFQRILLVSLLLLPYAINSSVRPRLPLLVTKAYLLGSTVQCGFAIYQRIALSSPLPNLVAVDYNSFDNSSLPRVGAFVGEPRHLAMLLVPSLIILLFRSRDMHAPQYGLFSRYNLLLHLIVLGLTASTSGVYTLVISSGVVLLLFTIQGHFRNILQFLFSAALILTATLVTIDPQVISERIIDRADTNRVLHSEFNTAASLELIQDYPIIAVTGVGVGVAPYLIKEMSSYEAAFSSTLYDPHTFIRNPPGLILIGLESGLLGMVTMIALLIWLVRTIMRNGATRASQLALLLLSQLIVGTVGAPPFTLAFFAGAAALLAVGGAGLSKPINSVSEKGLGVTGWRRSTGPASNR